MPEELTKNGIAIIDLDSLKQIVFDAVDGAIARHFEKPKKEKMLKIKEAAALLDTDPSTLWHWNKEGYLRKIYIGGKPRYKESEVLAILEGRQITKKTNTQ